MAKRSNSMRPSQASVPGGCHSTSPIVTHAATFERFRNLAATLTRQAADAYAQAKARQATMEAETLSIYDELPEMHTRDAKGIIQPATSDQDELIEHSQRWACWTNDLTSLLVDTENCLLHAILRWDASIELDTNLGVYPPRGVIHNGSLYLALPDDEEKRAGEQWTVLRIIPMAAIVDLGREGGQ
jgi:hypothetical protein